MKLCMWSKANLAADLAEINTTCWFACLVYNINSSRSAAADTRRLAENIKGARPVWAPIVGADGAEVCGRSLLPSQPTTEADGPL